MTSVRRLLAQRHLAVLICAAALFVKLLVPAGYMIQADGGHATIAICSGIASESASAVMAGMHAGMAGHGQPREHGKAEMPCAFSSLSTASLGAVDPVIVALAIGFVMAIGPADVVASLPMSPGHLRPPLRGPPTTF